jgi:hypothetical protein
MEFSKIEIAGGVTILAAVITALWTLLTGHQKRETARLDKYEELHEKGQTQIIELTGEYRELKGRIDTIEKVNIKLDGIEKLSASVLEELKKG